MQRPQKQQFAVSPKQTGSLEQSLEPFGKIEWDQRQPDSQCRVLVKRMSWSWFSAELIRIWPTEVEFRVKKDAAYLALHDSVRSDGMTTINGGSCSTLTDLRDKL